MWALASANLTCDFTKTGLHHRYILETSDVLRRTHNKRFLMTFPKFWGTLLNSFFKEIANKRKTK